MKLVLLLPIIFLLSACIVRPAVHPKAVKTKTTVVLEKEHKNKTVVIVNVRPAKSKKCWAHNRHWHCRR